MEEGLEPQKLAFIVVGLIVVGLLLTPEGQQKTRQVIQSVRNAVPLPNESFRPGWCNKSDWKFILQTTNSNLIASRLIAAIGLHETEWGKTGVGRDFICGYGVYDRSATGQNINQKDSRFRGFENQIRGVWYKIKQYFGNKPPKMTPEQLQAFNRLAWKASDQNWAFGVWASYKKTQN